MSEDARDLAASIGRDHQTKRRVDSTMTTMSANQSKSDESTRSAVQEEPRTVPDMPRDQQHVAVRALVDLMQRDSTHLADAHLTVATDMYIDDAHFDRETQRIFHAMPFAVGPSQHVARPGDMLAFDYVGLPVVVVRDREGVLRAFVNACRHRGSRLVAPGRTTCKGRITCGYHAWSYSDDGALVHVPREHLFGAVDRNAHGLRALPVAERSGIVWICGASADDSADAEYRLDRHLAPLSASLAGYQFDRCAVLASERKHWRFNWKLGIESGLESHHINVLHRRTIAPLFMVDLMRLEARGEHLRVYLPKRTLAQAVDDPPASWQLRRYSNVVYFLAPNALLLVDTRFTVQFQMWPISAHETRVDSHMLVHADERAARPDDDWHKYFETTMTALDEDYVMAESIQHSMRTRAHTRRTFGRNELGLQRYHHWLDARLEGRDPRHPLELS